MPCNRVLDYAELSFMKMFGPIIDHGAPDFVGKMLITGCLEWVTSINGFVEPLRQVYSSTTAFVEVYRYRTYGT